MLTLRSLELRRLLLSELYWAKRNGTLAGDMPLHVSHEVSPGVTFPVKICERNRAAELVAATRRGTLREYEVTTFKFTADAEEPRDGRGGSGIALCNMSWRQSYRATRRRATKPVNDPTPTCTNKTLISSPLLRITIKPFTFLKSN